MKAPIWASSPLPRWLFSLLPWLPILVVACGANERAPEPQARLQRFISPEPGSLSTGWLVNRQELDEAVLQKLRSLGCTQ